MPTRFAMAGMEEYPNRIDFSEEADFNNWTVGGDPTDPITQTIVSPGSKMTHITYAHDRLYWFKEESFGYVAEGPTHGDWYISVISNNLGTKDNSSIYEGGILRFRGQDGHFYAFDGSALIMLSRDIQETVEASQPRRQNLWDQTTSDDFGAGSFTPHVYGDTVTTSGQLGLTFPEYFYEYRDGSNDTKDVWDEYLSGTVTGDAGVSDEELYITHDGGTLGHYSIVNHEKLPAFGTGTTYYLKIMDFPVDTGWNSEFYLVFTTATCVTKNPSSGDEIDRFYLDFFGYCPKHHLIDFQYLYSSLLLRGGSRA